MRNACLLIVFYSLLFSQVFAQKNEIEVNGSDKIDTLTFVDKLLRYNDMVYKIMVKTPAPIITYSTETNWVFGLAKFNAFQLSKKDSLSRASSVGESVGFSMYGQMFLGVGSKFYWDESNNIAEATVRLEKFPRQFWGVGNEINPDSSALVTKSYFSTDLKYRRMVFENIYVGASYHFYDVFNVSVDSGNFVVQEYSDAKAGINSGIGLNVMYDSRDNVYNTGKGIFATLESQYYLSWLGSDFSFTRLKFDFRAFRQLPLGFSIGYQLYTETNFGESIPLYSYAYMGGSDRMRGYYNGQYRDKTIIDTQVELRRHLFWVIGAAAFISAGEVMPTYGDFTTKYIRMSAGGGLRFEVDPKNKINLRLDAGFGPGFSTLFFGFSEAF